MIQLIIIGIMGFIFGFIVSKLIPKKIETTIKRTVFNQKAKIIDPTNPIDLDLGQYE